MNTCSSSHEDVLHSHLFKSQNCQVPDHEMQSSLQFLHKEIQPNAKFHNSVQKQMKKVLKSAILSVLGQLKLS